MKKFFNSEIDRTSACRRRLPRYPIPNEQIKIQLDKANEKVFGIREMSAMGLSINFLEYGETLLFPVDQKFESTLHLGKLRLTLKLVVRRVNAWAAGFEFLELSESDQQNIAAYLDPIKIAKSLRSVPLEGTQNEALEGVSRWYHGDSNTEIYIWDGSEQTANKCLVLNNGNFWEWESSTGIRTGEYELEKDQSFRFAAHLRYDGEICAMVRKILENADILEYRQAKYLLAQIGQ